MRKILTNCRNCSEPIDPLEKRPDGGNINVCKSCRAAYFKTYNATRSKSKNTPTEEQKQKKKYYAADYWIRKQSILTDYHARYRKENRERINARQRAYREKNLKAVKDSRRNRKHITNARLKYRYETEPCYKLKILIRARVQEILQKMKKPLGFTAGSSYRLLNCSLPELKGYLETQFRNGMSWDNHGAVWELDHIKPLAAFDPSNPIQIAEACHYTNLQPLLCKENTTKSDFYKGSRARTK